MSKLTKRLLKLLGIMVIVVPIIILGFYRGKFAELPGFKTLFVKKPQAIKVDKTDPKWLENYCLAQVKNLPEAPFKYLNKDIHTRSRTGVSDVYLKKYVSDDKWFKAETCVIWYPFDPKAAYPSIGVEYVFNIKSSNTFQENTDTLYTAALNKVDKNWKKLSPIDDKEGGRPFYTYKGFPMIFTRENKDLNTVEYATVEFGSNELYVHFIVYER